MLVPVKSGQFKKDAQLSSAAVTSGQSLPPELLDHLLRGEPLSFIATNNVVSFNIANATRNVCGSTKIRTQSSFSFSFPCTALLMDISFLFLKVYYWARFYLFSSTNKIQHFYYVAICFFRYLLGGKFQSLISHNVEVMRRFCNCNKAITHLLPYPANLFFMQSCFQTRYFVCITACYHRIGPYVFVQNYPFLKVVFLCGINICGASMLLEFL